MFSIYKFTNLDIILKNWIFVVISNIFLNFDLQHNNHENLISF